jgi:hypothetical protein
VSPETLAKLKAKLDWRKFVRTDDLTLINLPNNYYGVAFSVARLRYRLGWEDASASEALLERTLDHYRKYSGEYGFADETDGEGRFDRYSVLLIGEISHRLIEAGMPATPEVKAWLRKSVDLMLPRLNLRGEGFEYGRSIGTYGETAFLEVLTAAAKLDVLTPKEKTMAYAFSSRVTARYMDFWFDPKMGSVNMWEHGRRTDTYRGKHRILGENLSLGRQYIYTSAIWNELGFKDKAPDPAMRPGWMRCRSDGDLVRARQERSAGRHPAGSGPRDRPADHQRRRKPAHEHALLSDPVLAGDAAGRGRRGVPAAFAAHHPGRRRAAGAAGLCQGTSRSTSRARGRS